MTIILLYGQAVFGARSAKVKQFWMIQKFPSYFLLSVGQLHSMICKNELPIPGFCDYERCRKTTCLCFFDSKIRKREWVYQYSYALCLEKNLYHKMVVMWRYMCLTWYIHHLFCLKKRFGELLVDVINRVRLFCCREFGLKITAFQIQHSIG